LSRRKLFAHPVTSHAVGNAVELILNGTGYDGQSNFDVARVGDLLLPNNKGLLILSLRRSERSRSNGLERSEKVAEAERPERWLSSNRRTRRTPR
jgi:hypothetical protein